MLDQMVLYSIEKKTKLTIKIDWNQPHINKCYYLKFSLPISPRQFFEKFSQNQEYGINFVIMCNVINHFHFACRQWYLYNS